MDFTWSTPAVSSQPHRNIPYHDAELAEQARKLTCQHCIPVAAQGTHNTHETNDVRKFMVNIEFGEKIITFVIVYIHQTM